MIKLLVTVISLIIIANVAEATKQGTVGVSSRGSITIKLEIPHKITTALTATTRKITVKEGCAIVSRVNHSAQARFYSDSSPKMLSLNCANFEARKTNDLSAIVYELSI